MRAPRCRYADALWTAHPGSRRAQRTRRFHPLSRVCALPAFPIEITADGWFPVVDELGSSLGMQIKPTESGLDSECQLRIETLAGVYKI